jgi:hypothetical protein
MQAYVQSQRNLVHMFENKNASKTREWLSSWVIVWENSPAIIIYYVTIITITETQPKHNLFFTQHNYMCKKF